MKQSHWVILIVIAVAVVAFVIAMGAVVAIRPLPDPHLERIRRHFASDLRGRNWTGAYYRFLRATNPGQPGSVSVEAIDSTYKQIFTEAANNPELR